MIEVLIRQNGRIPIARIVIVNNLSSPDRPARGNYDCTLERPDKDAVDIEMVNFDRGRGALALLREVLVCFEVLGQKRKARR